MTESADEFTAFMRPLLDELQESAPQPPPTDDGLSVDELMAAIAADTTTKEN